MILPLRDDQPSFSTPFINYFLVVSNVLVFFWELSVGMQSRVALNAFLVEFGVVPSHILAVLTGHSHDRVATAILPLFTSMFLHGSFLHVASNMLMLWIFGDNVEDYLGHFRYLLFYLSVGLIAATTQILGNVYSRVPVIGASGAIAGVMGAYFVLYPRARVLTWVLIFLFRVPAWVILGGWFLLNLLSGTATSISDATQASGGGIAFWAHIGGFVSGVVLIKFLSERPQRHRYGAW
jgi:membrane associated rhomboid family serine protease